VKLDGGKGNADSGNLPVDSNGRPEDDFSSAGASIKARFSKTELHYGNLQPNNPVLATAGTRATPQTATGFNLLSSEIEGLNLDAGHFTSQ
jgi:imipenem/basic amino acid-specific outer membrane pore